MVTFKQRDGEPEVKEVATSFLHTTFLMNCFKPGAHPQFTTAPTHHYLTYQPFQFRSDMYPVWICLIFLILTFLLPVSKTGSESFLIGSFISIVVYKLKQK